MSRVVLALSAWSSARPQWRRARLLALVGVLLLALVFTMSQQPQRAAADPTPPPAEPKVSARWVEPTGTGVVRPDWVSASVTARMSGQRVEVLSQRSPSGRTWLLPSGLVQSEVTGLVRFRDLAATRTDGWRDIDTTLQASSDGSVSPAAMPDTVRLSGGGDGDRLVAVTDAAGGSVRLGSGLPGVVLPKPVLDGSTATYADVLAGVDLRVVVRRSGFEQLWVIKDKVGLDRLLAARGSGNEVSLTGPMTLARKSAAEVRLSL